MSNLETLCDQEIERRKKTAKSMADNCPPIVKKHLDGAKNFEDFCTRMVEIGLRDMDFITMNELYDAMYPKGATCTNKKQRQ